MKTSRSWKQFFTDLWYIQLYPVLVCYKELIAISIVFILFIIWGGVQLGLFRPPLSNIRGLEAIPTSTTFIFETQDLKKSITRITETTYNEDLNAIPLFEKWYKELKSFITFFENSDNKKYNKFFEKKYLVAAAQINGIEDFDWLFVLEGGGQSKRMIMGMQWNLLDQHNYRGQKIYFVQLPDSSKWYFCSHRGLLLFSKLAFLVEEGIEQLDDFKKSLTRNSIFRKLDAQTGQSDLGVYVNFNSLPIFMSMLTPLEQPDLALLGEYFDFLGLDSRFEEENFVMSGHLYQNKKNNYLNWLVKQPLSKNGTLAKMLPSNVAMAAYFNLTTFDNYYRKLPKKASNTDFSRYILPWLGEEAAYFITEPTSTNLKDDKFVLLKAKDSSKAKKMLIDLGAVFGVLDTINYQGVEMIQLAANNLLSPIFGNYLQPLENPYYLIIDDYVLFCNSAAVLEIWIDHYQNRKMLTQSKLFKGCIEQMQNNSSIYILLNSGNTAQLLKSFMKKNVFKEFDKRFIQFRSLTPIGIQLSAHQGHFLATLSIAKNKLAISSKTNIAWRTVLKTDAAIAPAVVRNHNNKELEVFVQDKDNRIYLLNRAGQILWEKPVDGIIISKIEQVDFYNNGKLQYAFNTNRSIYVFDRNGDLVKRIPLVSRAINGLLAINYGKGIRFFVGCADGKIYGFDKYGKPLNGWNPNRKFGGIKQPLEYLELEDKDYVIALSPKGKLFFAKRNGKIRFTKKLGGYYTSNFVIDKTAKRVVAAATNGKIQVVNFEGKKFGIPASKGMRKDVHFAHLDVLGDTRLDFIRLSNKKLVIHVYDSTNTLTETLDYSYDLTQNDIFPIHLVGKKQGLIGSYNQSEAKIYLFDPKTKKMVKGFPLLGNTKFTVLDFFEDNNNTLLVAHGKQILAYKLKT